MSRPETTLATLPASQDDERVLVVLVQDQHGTTMELRQQSRGEGVGWFTQSTVELQPQQIAEMRLALGSVSHTARPAKAASSSPGFVPRVIHAESA